MSTLINNAAHTNFGDYPHKVIRKPGHGRTHMHAIMYTAGPGRTHIHASMLARPRALTFELMHALYHVQAAAGAHAIIRVRAAPRHYACPGPGARI